MEMKFFKKGLFSFLSTYLVNPLALQLTLVSIMLNYVLYKLYQKRIIEKNWQPVFGQRQERSGGNIMAGTGSFSRQCFF